MTGEQGFTLQVRVTPRSARDEIVGWEGEVLRVRLRAPPIEGRANEALRKLIAETVGVPASNVEVVRGATARTKSLRITGTSEEQALRRVGRV